MHPDDIYLLLREWKEESDWSIAHELSSFRYMITRPQYRGGGMNPEDRFAMRIGIKVCLYRLREKCHQKWRYIRKRFVSNDSPSPEEVMSMTKDFDEIIKRVLQRREKREKRG